MIRNHIDDLKQQHIEELMSCKSQFETDIKEALERTKWRQTVDDEVEEPIQTFLIEQQSYESEPGEYLPLNGFFNALSDNFKIRDRQSYNSHI